MLSARAEKNTNILLVNELEDRAHDNSIDLTLLNKYCNNDVGKIHDKFDLEENKIRNEIASLDKTEQRAEYEDLMLELKDMKEEEDNQVKHVEEEAHDKEEGIQIENDTIEVRIQALKAENESLDGMMEQDIQNSFGYFR